jgi:hypothetical protein
VNARPITIVTVTLSAVIVLGLIAVAVLTFTGHPVPSVLENIITTALGGEIGVLVKAEGGGDSTDTSADG